MDTENYCSDILTKDFLKKYSSKKVNWKNGLAYIVYKRTYSRQLQNGNTEEYWQTLARCINGAQKIGAQYSQKEAERLYDYMFNFKCLYAGRMLWQLGTPLVDKFNGNSLINCFYTNISSIEDFCFLFENLMLGGGVGYSVRREHVHELPKIKSGVTVKHECTKDADLIVPDSRSGWISLLRKTLESYFENGKSFTYSTILVRGYGEPIKTFGGTASGPKILIDGIEKICSIFKSREGKKLRSIDALDICNLIGSIVVAGNVRRSAQIALGDSDDYLFLRAKRWDDGNVPNWRSMSNNTICADEFDYISDLVWDGYNGVGEPYGFFNLNLTQKYGRLGEKIQDVDIQGLNPCQPGWAKLMTPEGIKTFSEVKIGDKIWSKSGWTIIQDKWSNGVKKIYRYATQNGNFVGTRNHRIVEHGQKIEVDNAIYIDTFTTTAWNVVETETIPSKIMFREYLGEEEVFDITVNNKSHTYWTDGCNVSNCGEIGLENGGVCNLSEIFLNNIENKNELTDCAKLLYKTQKAVCSLDYIHERTTKIVHKNRRIGLGIGGICQALNKIEWLDDCYKELRKFDKEWSKKRDWPESIKLTTIKPSGTISLVAGCTPGIHTGIYKHYIRRVRMASDDKLVQICKEHGYKTEFQINFDDSIDRNTMIVEFPCVYEGETKLTNAFSAIEQLELLKKIQTEWADNAVSCTVYYKKEELKGIKEWLSKNYNNSIKSVSFLLHKEDEHGFKQPPYQEISEEQYNELIKNVKPFNNIQINDELIDSLECSSGVCPVR